MRKLYFIVLSLLLLITFIIVIPAFYKNDSYNFVLNLNDVQFDNEEYDIGNYYIFGATDGKQKSVGSKVKEETVKINISDELYNNYRGVGDVDHTVSMKPVKVTAYNGIISFRYLNDLHPVVDSMDMALDFRLELERSGYRLLIDSEKKKIYEGDEYKVVILKEFNYLIIVIIEK